MKLDNSKLISKLIKDISLNKTKEELKTKLLELKEDKTVKDELIDGIFIKIFGDSKVGWYLRIALKTYLYYKYGI